MANVAVSHSGSISTELSYRRAFKSFCLYAGTSPSELLRDYDGSSEKVFKRRWGAVVKQWIAQLSGEGLSRGTIQTYAAVVRSFFKYNDLPLGYVPVGRPIVTFHNRDISKAEIQTIVNMSRPRERAFFVMMMQSGLRPKTLCQLRFKHVLPDYQVRRVPCRVVVPQELAKGKFGRYFTFMGEEAVELLSNYLATRGRLQGGDYLFTCYGKSDKPAARRSLSQIFVRNLEVLKANGHIDFDQPVAGKPRELRLYCLRKYFRNNASKAGRDFVSFWMGHSMGVDEHYWSREGIEKNRQRYSESALPFLRLEQPTPLETEEAIADLRAKLKEQNLILEELQNPALLKVLRQLAANPDKIRQVLEQ